MKMNLPSRALKWNLLLAGLLLIAALPAATLAAPAADTPIVLKSPDGGLAITFQAAPGRRAGGAGQLTYAVAFQGKPLILPSALGLELQGARPLGAAVRIASAATSATDATYRLVTGKASAVRNHFNAARLELEETGAPGRKLTLEARAYDDAVAFRYVVPAQPGLGGFRLVGEKTQFRLAKDAFAHALVLPHFKSMYESEYVNLPLSAFGNQGGVASSALFGCPLLLDVPGVAWLALTEADLSGNAAMYLANSASGWSKPALAVRLSPDARDEHNPLCVSAGLPHHSAWRVLMVGAEPGRLIESNVLTSLAPPPALAETGWIKPGRAAWDWWSGSLDRAGRHAFTTENMKDYVDFAAKNGLEYMLVDAGWAATGDITRQNGRVDIPAVVRYAAPKGVRVWIWINYREADRQMDEAFALYEKWGVAGVKIDFIERDDQAGLAFYDRAAATAARHHLMVDFHGCTKPSGLDRTWPNVMGYEAVLGMEQSKGCMRDNPVSHVTLPFTRMLAGRMDYTPGGFNNVTREEFIPRGDAPMVMGTRAHHLAMYVVFESPFQMVADCPAAYAGQPAFEFIKRAPASWDETRVLGGTPGEFIALARRHGREWFLGAMTNWTARRLELPLGFLGQGRFTAEVYADAPDSGRFPKKVEITKQTVTRESVLKAALASGGGCAVRFIPQP